MLIQVRSGSNYGAFGLSSDGKMGDDLVFSCSASGALAAWNSGKSNKLNPTGVTIATAEQTASVVNGVTKCDFMVDEMLAITAPDETDERTYDLKNTQYFLLVATGKKQDTATLL